MSDYNPPKPEPTPTIFNTINYEYIRMGNQGYQGWQGIDGPAGNPGGPQGNQGNQGVPGNPGGAQGNQGNQGFQGFQGNQGTQGSQGFQGFQGNQGYQGNQGDVGFQGVQGFQGFQGNQGNQGFQGNQGDLGYQGVQGPQGFQGNQGFQGLQGPQGWQGFQGNQGFQGRQGSTGYQGDTGSPGSAVDTMTMYQALGSSTKAIIYGAESIGFINTQLGLNTKTRLYLTGIYVPVSATLSGATWFQTTQGVYNANNYNGIGLYSISGPTGTLVASSANDSTIWKKSTDTWNKKLFSVAYSASPGVYYIAMLYNYSSQTTTPQLGGNDPTFPILQFDFTYPCSGYIDSYTSLPATIDLTAIQENSSGRVFWLNVY